MKDWRAWHDGYDDPDSPLSHRLRAVQDQIRAYLATAPAGPIRVVSACSGLGLDLVGALDGHPRLGDVSGRLVELDQELAARSRQLVADAGLDLEVVTGDAGATASYAAAVPADLVLLCGIFGNVGDEDIRTTTAHTTRLCAPGATVIWTRHQREPDLTPTIRQWWADAGYEEVEFVTLGEQAAPAVGVHRLTSDPLPFEATRLFTFG